MSRQTNLGLDNAVAAPVDIARPIISGTPRVGQTLTVRNAVWFKGVTGATYQWRRNGVNIGGATNQSYTLVGDDEEKTIDCMMVGTNAQGNDESLSDSVLCYTTVTLPAATLSTRAFSLQALSGAELATINTNFSGAVIERISPNDGRLLVSSDGKLIRGMSNTGEEPFELSIYTTHPKAETKRSIIKVTFVDQNVFTTFAQLLNGKQRAGVSLAGLEFAGESLPGKLDIGGQGPRPTPDSVPAYWATQDVTNFRIPIPWERLQPDLNGPLGCIFEPKSNSAADIADPNRDFMVLLTNMFAGIAKVNGKFIFDIHNYAARGVKSPDGVWITSAALAAANNMPAPTGRNGKYAIGSATVTIDHFANLHERIAEEFLFGRWRPYLKNLAGIDFMNEPVQLPNGSGTVRDMYQAALNKSRAVGYRGLAFLEGYVFASFADWSDYATPGTLDAIVDPAQNIVWSGHDYDDANHTGTYTGDEANKPVYGQLLTRGATAVLNTKSVINWVNRLTPEQRKYTAGVHMGETNAPNTREWQEAQRLKFVALRDANCLFHVWAAWTVEVERVLNVLPVPFATNRGPDKIVTDLLRKVNNGDAALNTPIGLGQIIVPALTGNPGGAAQMDNGAGGKTAAVVTNRTVGATIAILLKSGGTTVATLSVNNSGVIIGALPPSATYDVEVNQTLGGLTYKQTFTSQMVITGADTTGSILLDGFESTNDAAGNARTITGTGATIAAANTRKVEGSLGITLTPADQTNRTVAVTAANLGSHDPATMDVLAYYQDYAESGLNRITDQNFQITRNGVTASKNNGDIAYPGGDWHAYAVSEMSNGASFASQPAGAIAASMRATQTGAEITFDALLKNAKGIPIFMFNYDDISSSQYENAFPLHVEFGFPATFFVPRDFVGNGGRINESQLATMYNSGIIDFGCDSTRDDSDANITDTDVDRAAALASLMANHDYLVSKGWTRNETHKHLCWANNRHSARLAQHFQENGFRMMRSTIPGLSGVNYVKHGIGRGRAKKLNSNPSLGTYTFDANYKATVDRALAIGGLWSMHMHGFSTSGNDTRPAEIRLLMEYLKPLVDAGKALVCSFGEAWSRFGGFTSNVVLTPPSGEIIGGVAIGAAGAAGSIYDGFTLSTGDEFKTLDIVGPASPRARWFTTRTYGAPNGGARGQDTLLGTMFDTDPLMTGHNDSNRGVPVGFDNMKVVSSVLSLQARRATTAEKLHFSPTGSGIVRNEVAAMLSGAGFAHWYTGDEGAGDILYEVRARFSAKAGNPAGWHATFWQSFFSGNLPDGDEWDFEGNSQGAYFGRNTWINGAVTNGQTGTRYDHDGQFHTFSILLNKTRGRMYIDGVLFDTINVNANQRNKLAHLILSSHVYNGNFNGELYSKDAWDADADGATLDVDWFRLWRRTGRGHFKPLVAVADRNVDYGATTVIALPAKLDLWGDASVLELVTSAAAEENEPGSSHASNYSQFPPGVSYNSTTRELTVNIMTGKPGRINFVVVGYLADGSTAEALRFAVNVGPVFNGAIVEYEVGVPFVYDVYAAFDCGVLTSNGVSRAKNVAVSGLPPWASYSAATGLVTGTPSDTGASTITVTGSNSLGQPASGSSSFRKKVVTGYAYESWTGPGWFDASNPATVVSSGGIVSQWNNRRSGGDDLAARNSQITLADAVQNGKQALRFARNTSSPAGFYAKALASSALSTMFQGEDKPFTVILVYRPTDTNTGYVWDAGGGDNTNSHNVAFIRRASVASDLRKQVIETDGANVAIVGPQPANTTKIVAITHTGKLATGWDTSLTKYIADAPQDVGPVVSSALFRMGYGSGPTGQVIATCCAMDVFEMIIEPTRRTDAEIQQAITDLATKWAVTLV